MTNSVQTRLAASRFSIRWTRHYPLDGVPGQALLIPNWIAGPLGLIAFFFIYLFRIEREEQQLIETFGDEYREYQKKTGRLFPK